MILRPEHEAVIEAARAWRLAKYAMHGNTAQASREHYERVAGAENRLRAALDALDRPAA